MQIIISPSKSQDFTRDFSIEKSGGVVSEKLFSVCEFNEETKKLSKITKSLSKKDLERIMKISQKLSELNFERFQRWNGNFLKRKKERSMSALGQKEVLDHHSFSPAIFAFSGDVYRGFDLQNWSKKDFEYAEKSLKIISGFYGVLTPLTFLKPYRLEMGTKLSFKIGKKEYKNLYEFWGEKITDYFLENFKKDKEKVLLNLASVEYSKVIDRKKLSENGMKIIDVDFKTSKNGVEKIVAIFAKRARGDMANWIIKSRIEKSSEIKYFKEDGWGFSPKDSSEGKLTFVKKK